MEVFATNETSELLSVVLGIGMDRGAPKGINPMSRKHLSNNTFPTEENICTEIRTFENVLIENGVQIHRPINLPKTEQIFTRDIGFVINDYFFISNMKHPSRSMEINGIKHILDKLDPLKIIEVPNEITIEGGDVILWNEFVFIGLGARTTKNAVQFIQNAIPDKRVIGLDIVTDQKNADKNILHLDCTFQPIGEDEAIIYYDGFKNPPKEILDLFPREKLIAVTLDEKNRMFPNIFSIAPYKVVVERGFDRLNLDLTMRGYEVFEVDYKQTSKLSGLLRCSTLPLQRKAAIAS